MRRRLLTSALSAIGAGLALTVAAPSLAETVNVHLKGFEEVPSISTAASGTLRLKIDDKAGTIGYELDYENLQGDVRMAHIHFGQRGVNGGIAIWLCGTSSFSGPIGTPVCPGPRSGFVAGTLTAANVLPIDSQRIAAGELDEIIAAIRAGVAYGNVHTNDVPGGEIRGQLN